jgi:hypothetical protein
LICSLQADNEDFKQQFLKLKEVFVLFNREQKLAIGDIKNDFLSLKEYNRLQLGSVKHVLGRRADQACKKSQQNISL